jgi:hypothetical protein
MDTHQTMLIAEVDIKRRHDPSRRVFPHNTASRAEMCPHGRGTRAEHDHLFDGKG